MAEEQFGHRGHPTLAEQRRAAFLAKRLHSVIYRLVTDQSFGDAEAEAFITGVAHSKGIQLGETWTAANNARRTVQDILIGHAAKSWSMDALTLALMEVEQLLDDD